MNNNKIIILFMMICFLNNGFARLTRYGIRIRQSPELKNRILIRDSWNCNPFTCNDNNWKCKLEKCSKFTQGTNTTCLNRAIGQNSTYCLNIGKNNLINNFFSGNTFNLVLEKDIVAECTNYKYYKWLVAGCQLYKVDIDIPLNKSNVIINNCYHQHYVFYFYNTTYDILLNNKRLFEMRKKQYLYYNNSNNQNSTLEFNNNYDIRVKYFEELLETNILESVPTIKNDNIKIFSKNGFSFTLPIGITYKYKLPFITDLSMDIQSYDTCYDVDEYYDYIHIKKTWECFFRLIRNLFSNFIKFIINILYKPVKT